MNRIVLVSAVFVVALAGCVGGTPCDPGESPTTCKAGGFCHPELKICIAGDGGTTGGGGGTTGGGGGATGGGTGGATGGGATGGGATGGGTGGGVGPSCTVACEPWQECVPSATGGTCVDGELRLEWTTPAMAGLEVSADMMNASLRVTKRDGGVVTMTAVPVSGAIGGRFMGSGGNYSGQLLLPSPDGVKQFDAGWGPMGPSVATTVVRNRTAPTLTIDTIAAAPSGAFDGGLDTRVPGGAAYRKDEVVTVRVRSPDLDTVGTSIQLSARYGAGAVTQLSTSTDCSSANEVCRAFQLDLSRVEMKAFRGDVLLSASGSDTAGNAAASVGTPSVSVTRFNWARYVASAGTTSGVVLATPAIGAGGKVYVPVANGALAGMVGLNPDGTVAWTNPAGAVAGVPVIGQTPANGEWLLYQLATGGGSVRTQAIGGSTGATCDPPPTTNGMNSAGGLVLVGSDSANVGAIGLQGGIAATGGGLLGKLTVPLSAQPCTITATGGLAPVLSPGNAVATGAAAFFVDEMNTLNRIDYTLSTVSTLANAGAIASVGAGVGTVNGLVMLSSTRLAGGGGGALTGKLFAVDVDGGVPWAATPSMSNPTSGPAVGRGAIYVQHKVGTGSSLYRVDATTGVLQAAVPLTASAFTGNVIGTPTLGQDGMVYAVDTSGRLFVVDQNFPMAGGLQWSEPLNGGFGTRVIVSPTLDCSRRVGAAGGVLYLATDQGWLVSYIVDAAGLDTTATWPKYARDARNSGNINGPSIGCP